MKRDLDKTIQENRDASMEVLRRVYKEMGLDLSLLNIPKDIKIKPPYHDGTAVGKEAIEASFMVFKESGLEMLLLQPDWLLCYKGSWYCIEIKNQTPQDGMFSIPKRQLLARVELEKSLNVRGVIMVLNRIDKMWYWQYISTLMADTAMVENKRYRTCLFPLSSFIPTYFLPG